MSKDYLDKWEERQKQNTEIIEQQQTKTKMSKEEIKSLGWLHDDSEPNNYVKGSWDLYHNPNTNYIKIDDADGYPIVFEGVIKDISELNNIMDKHKNQNKEDE